MEERAPAQAPSSGANQHRQAISWAAANWYRCPVNAHLASRVCLAEGISQFHCVYFTDEDARIAVASAKECMPEEDLVGD